MGTMRNKLATTNKDKYEDHPRNNQARKRNSPRTVEDYITLVSEEIEGRVTKKLSQKLISTEAHFGRLVPSRGISSETTRRGSIRTRSGDIPELKQKKLGNE